MKNVGLLFLILILLSTSCIFDNETDDNNDEQLTINFLNGRIAGSGYAILEIDGNFQIKSVQGDQTITFEDINLDRGNIYIIDKYYYSPINEYIVDINFYKNVKLSMGEWFLRGHNYVYNTDSEYKVTLNYPNQFYNKYMVSSSWSSGTFNNYAGSTSVTVQEKVPYLDSNNNISFFNAIYLDSDSLGGKYAYCDWELDRDFNIGEVNEFVFDLDKTMEHINISTSRPIDSYSLEAFTNSLNDAIYFDSDPWTYNSGTTNNFDLFYNDDFPYEKLQLRLYRYAYDGKFTSWGFDNIYENINDISFNDIEIPNTEIDGNYNTETKSFNNIKINGGVADNIGAGWIYYSDSIRVFLDCITSTSVSSITLPELPSNVLDDINIDIDFNDFEPNLIFMNDYDTCDNWNDMIKLFFKNEQSYYNFYNTRYSTSKYFASDKRMQMNRRLKSCSQAMLY